MYGTYVRIHYYLLLFDDHNKTERYRMIFEDVMNLPILCMVQGPGTVPYC